MKKVIAIIVCLLLATIMVFVFKQSKRNKEAEVKHDIIVQHIEELGQLEVVKYTVKDVVEYRKMRNWLPNPKAVLIITGEVFGCIDLTKITADDVTIVKDSLDILLPSPEICHVKVDHLRSRIYNVEYGLWETANLVDEAYRSAEQQLLIQAINMGVEDESKQNAVKILKPMFSMLGYKKITIRFKDKEDSGYVRKDGVNVTIP